jgi:transcriptional regulator with XRE-family HTH domain
MEERACTLVALKFMVARVGTAQELAFRMGIDRTAVRRALKGRPLPGVRIALDIARVAGVPVDDVISGRFPGPGACHACGRSDAG